MKGRAEVTGSGLDYSVFNIGEPLGYTGPELSQCYPSFQPTSKASYNSTKPPVHQSIGNFVGVYRRHLIVIVIH